MNILFITWDYLPAITGRIVYLKNLVQELAEKNINCYIVTGTFKGQKRIEKRKNITIYRTPYLNVHRKRGLQKISHQLLKFLQKIIEEKNIDLISAQNFHLSVVDGSSISPSFALAINGASIITNKPVILTMHSYCQSKVDEELLKNLNWSKIIGISKSAVEHAYNLGIKTNKLAKVYNGVDTFLFKPGLGKEWFRNKFGFKDKDIIILCPTRVLVHTLESKGLKILLKSMSIIESFSEKIKLVIVAAPTHPHNLRNKKRAINELKNLSKVYEIENKLTIIDGLKNEEMPLAYNGADIMVLPSIEETFGIVYIEAMACGLPVIGCSIPGVSEIITNSNNGYLIAPDNDVALAKRIAWLIRDKKKKMRELGRRARETVKKNFTLKMMVDETLEIYKKVIDENK